MRGNKLWPLYEVYKAGMFWHSVHIFQFWKYFKIKMWYYLDWNSHDKDKMVLWPYYLYNVIPTVGRKHDLYLEIWTKCTFPFHTSSPCIYKQSATSGCQLRIWSWSEETWPANHVIKGTAYQMTINQLLWPGERLIYHHSSSYVPVNIDGTDNPLTGYFLNLQKNRCIKPIKQCLGNSSNITMNNIRFGQKNILEFEWIWY